MCKPPAPNPNQLVKVYAKQSEDLVSATKVPI